MVECKYCTAESTQVLKADDGLPDVSLCQYHFEDLLKTAVERLAEKGFVQKYDR
jgi:hypothetical protein